jgi:hypothetical protein
VILAEFTRFLNSGYSLKHGSTEFILAGAKFSNRVSVTVTTQLQQFKYFLFLTFQATSLDKF